MNPERPSLNIAFESARLSYSDLEVDLYNSGVNQILSVAASRGHFLYHFSMADLYLHDGVPYARASILALPQPWQGDPTEAYLSLKKMDERPLPLHEIQLCFIRGDDIRHTGTPNLHILQMIENHGLLIENTAATLSTCDKYELVRRAPHIPQPVTFPARSLEEAMEAINLLPDAEGYFVLKDRYGYGCGEQVHRIEFGDPQLEEVISMYLSTYNYILLQEFCPEVRNGDVVVTFFDGELIAPMHREAGWGEWRTTVSQGGIQRFYTLTPEQEHIVRAVIAAFPECRFASVDLLQSGKVLEINAFPGGKGLMEIYGISVGALIMDRLEEEILGIPAPPAIKRYPVTELTQWDHIYKQYEQFKQSVEVLDVFTSETYVLRVEDLIEFRPRSSDFILSIPHSGVLIPTGYAERFKLSPDCLVEIDLYNDILYQNLDGLQLICRLAPFFVDMNRKRYGSKDMDVPEHLKNPASAYYTVNGELLLKKPYTPAEEEQILRYYDLYHGILSMLIEHMKAERGYALILDAHSMTSVGLGRVYDEGQERSNFVVGTLDDTSADPEIITAFMEALRAGAESHHLGLTLAKNEPYSGGFITRRYGNPGDNVQAIQVEITMDTYMYEPVDERLAKRYALKQPRIKIVQDVLSHAMRAAFEVARRLYS
ncbi:MAG: N-formylglutamate amidohydrolase [Syntrophobacteria bacterium]